MPVVRLLAVILLLLAGLGPLALAQVQSEPVELDGRVVLRVTGGGDLTAAERARLLERRLEIFASPASQTPTWTLGEHDGSFTIYTDKRPFMTLSKDDLALLPGAVPRDVAEGYQARLEEAIERARRERAPDHLFRQAALAATVTAIALIAFMLSLWLFRRFRGRIEAGRIPILDRPLHALQAFPPLADVDPRPWLTALNTWLLRLAGFLLFWVWLVVVLRLFPQTRDAALWLLDAVTYSLGRLGLEVAGFLPNLVTIVVTLIATLYVVRLIRFVFQRMVSRPETLGFGMPPDLLDALGRVAVALMWIFAIMIVAPLLPGLGTQTGQVVALLLGAMITLGSSSAVGNAVAGFMLTYIRPFEVGHRVRIGEYEGDIVHRRFTSIKLRTIRNEVVTFTSTQVLNALVVNYSAAMRPEDAPFLRVSASIGYGVPRRTVEGLFLAAAERTDGVVIEPAPFVMVLALGDYAVTYELNAAFREPHLKHLTQSELNKHVLDVFAEAGVEILSPMYNAVRDGNLSTLPPPFRQP